VPFELVHGIVLVCWGKILLELLGRKYMLIVFKQDNRYGENLSKINEPTVVEAETIILPSTNELFSK
jgi:hypothetical protein